MKTKRRIQTILAVLVPLQGATAAIDLNQTGAATSTLYGDCLAPCNDTDTLSVDLGPTTGSTGILTSEQTVSGAASAESA
ncbi:MAG: hypothetical protein ACU85U_13500 [Gammaproteobacteria bacterium]|jgi:hypothetical protein